jgi:hypothetical protein
MPIAGKPVYASDVNTLAQLDLQRTIAQQKATQEAIAGASRGAQNWIRGFGGAEDRKLKEKQLGILEGQQEREDKERMERYTFDSTQRAIQEGILDADQLDEILPNFQDPTRQAILREEAKRLRLFDTQLDEEGPQVANRLNQATAYEQRTLERARQDLAKAQEGWKIPGVGWGPGSEANIEDAQNRLAMAEAALQQKETALYEAYPQFQNRFQLGEGGYRYLPKRRGGSGMGSQVDALPDTGGVRQDITVAPQEPVVGVDILPEDQGYAPPAGQPSAMAPDVLPPPESSRSPRGAALRTYPPVDQAVGRGGGRGPTQLFGTPRGRPARGAYRGSSMQQVQPTTETEPIPSQGQPETSTANQLPMEVKNEYYSRAAQWERSGLPREEALRRADLWLRQQIDAGVF